MEGGLICSETSAPPGQSWRQGLGHSGAGKAHKVTTLTIQSEAEDLQGQRVCADLRKIFNPESPVVRQEEFRVMINRKD